jgi:hypothetical protein
MGSETTARKDHTLILVPRNTAMTKRRFHQFTMHDRTTKRVHNRWTAPTAFKAATSSEWDQAARKPINDLLEDLYTYKELEEREKRRAIFSFFELPREIREEIYHYAWSSVVFCYLHEDFNSIACAESLYGSRGQTVAVRYGTGLMPDSIETFPEWVGTHPLLENEAMQQLHKGAVFSILGRGLTECWQPLHEGGPSHMTVAIGAGTAIIMPNLLENYSPLLSLTKAAKVQVWGNSASRLVTGGRCSLCSYRWEAKQETKYALFPVLAAPSDRFKGLRELDLTLTLPDFYHDVGGETGSDNLQWDFSLFDKLPRRVSRLRIRLYKYDCGRSEHDWNSTGLLWQKVHQECADRAEAFMRELVDEQEGISIREGMEPRGPDNRVDIWFCEAVRGHYNRYKRAMDRQDKLHKAQSAKDILD